MNREYTNIRSFNINYKNKQNKGDLIKNESNSNY